MKRKSNNPLSGRRLILPILGVMLFSFLSTSAFAKTGFAIRVQAKLPRITAKAQIGSYQNGIRLNRHTSCHEYQITKVDRKIAKKLAKRTDFSKQELLGLKKAGYTWNQIGQLLRLPNRLMQKVMKKGSLKTRIEKPHGFSRHKSCNDHKYGNDRIWRLGTTCR